MTLDHTNARWADGPKLLAWLESKGVNPNHYGSFGRRASAWRRGAAADFYTVDRLLCAAGLMAFEVPDDVWREKAPVGGSKPGVKRKGRYSRGKLTAAQVVEIRRRLRFGASKKALGREFGVSDSAIGHIERRWTWGHLEDEVAA